MSKSSTRAKIPHAARHTALKWGTVPPLNNPHYEVPKQPEPTPEHPVRLHKVNAGHSSGGSRTPK